MTTKHIPELAFLLTNVEKRYGRKVATSSDFESLSIVIEHHTGELISSSTLKRLWGYVNLNPTPRIATLDILSRFIGHRDFQDFCDSLTESDTFVSTFFTSKYLAVSELSAGTRITIGWAPNRVVDLLYLGEFLFEVEHSANSQLKVKDRMEISSIIVGYPLVISRILRDGEYTSSYIAGRQGGINLLKLKK